MQTKIREYPSGWIALFERLPNGMYLANVRSVNGDLHDKIRCDDRRAAMDYFRAFCAIARNGGR